MTMVPDPGKSHSAGEQKNKKNKANIQKKEGRERRERVLMAFEFLAAIVPETQVL